MRARATLFATIAVVAVAGCKDSGLPDRNLPIDEAAHRAPDALVQAVHPETRAGAEGAAAMPTDEAHAGAATQSRAITIGEQTFLPAGMPMDVDPALLTQVGAGGGMSFHAVRGDEAPYDRVFMTHPGGRYITYMPVHDDSGDPAARVAAQHDGMASGGAAH
ncbi:MAG TPA: hypothetical protein VF039_14670 [Longimicrobiales bacterium]